MSHQTVYFVTGANRGIGLELVKQLAEKPSNIVYGTARDLASAHDLKKLASSHPNFKPLEADVVDPETIANAANVVAKDHGYVDVLISNAGIADAFFKIKDIALADLTRQWDVNAKGPVTVYQAFRPLVLKSQEKKLVFVSTLGGSVGGFVQLPNPAYGASKAALNSLARAIAAESKDEGLKVLAIHPGVVSSDMGTTFGNYVDFSKFGFPVITPVESAIKVIQEVEKFNETDKFLSYDGSTLPW